MKPRLIDRILLAFVLLLFISGLVALILCVSGVIDRESQTAVTNLFLTDGWGYAARITIGALSAIFIIIAVKLLFTGSKPKEDVGAKSSLLVSDENGAAYISSATIDSMAQKYIRSNNRVKECTSIVRAQDDGGVFIDIKLTVLADTNIPELCSGMRAELKEYIETYSGIPVKQITIVVVNIYQPAGVRMV